MPVTATPTGTTAKGAPTRMGANHLTVIPAAVPERHLYRVPEAMELLSMSRSVIYEQMRSGRLRSVCQGRTRLIPAVAIQKYIALLLSESEASYDQSA